MIQYISHKELELAKILSSTVYFMNNEMFLLAERNVFIMTILYFINNYMLIHPYHSHYNSL